MDFSRPAEDVCREVHRGGESVQVVTMSLTRVDVPKFTGRFAFALPVDDDDGDLKWTDLSNFPRPVSPVSPVVQTSTPREETEIRGQVSIDALSTFHPGTMHDRTALGESSNESSQEEKEEGMWYHHPPYSSANSADAALTVSEPGAQINPPTPTIMVFPNDTSHSTSSPPGAEPDDNLLSEPGVIPLGAGWAGGPQVLPKPPLWRRRARGDNAQERLSLKPLSPSRRSSAITSAKSPLSNIPPLSSQLSPVSTLLSKSKSILGSAKSLTAPLAISPSAQTPASYSGPSVRRGFVMHDHSPSEASFASVTEADRPLFTTVPLDLNRTPIAPPREQLSRPPSPQHEPTSWPEVSSPGLPQTHHTFDDAIPLRHPQGQRQDHDHLGTEQNGAWHRPQTIQQQEKTLEDLDAWRRQVDPSAGEDVPNEVPEEHLRTGRDRRRASVYRRMSQFGARDITAEHGLEQGDEDEKASGEGHEAGDEDLHEANYVEENMLGPRVQVYAEHGSWENGAEGKRKKGLFGRWKKKLGPSNGDGPSRNRPRRSSSISSEKSFEAPERYVTGEDAEAVPQDLNAAGQRDTLPLDAPSFIRPRPRPRQSDRSSRRVSWVSGGEVWTKRVSRNNKTSDDVTAAAMRAGRRAVQVLGTRSLRSDSESASGPASADASAVDSSAPSTPSALTAAHAAEKRGEGHNRRSVIQMTDLVPFPVPPSRRFSASDSDHSMFGTTVGEGVEDDVRDEGVLDQSDALAGVAGTPPSHRWQHRSSSSGSAEDEDGASFHSVGEGETLEDMESLDEGLSLAPVESRMTEVEREVGEDGAGVVVGQAVRVSVYNSVPGNSRKASVYMLDPIHGSQPVLTSTQPETGGASKFV